MVVLSWSAPLNLIRRSHQPAVDLIPEPILPNPEIIKTPIPSLDRLVLDPALNSNDSILISYQILLKLLQDDSINPENPTNQNLEEDEDSGIGFTEESILIDFPLNPITFPEREPIRPFSDVITPALSADSLFRTNLPHRLVPEIETHHLIPITDQDAEIALFDPPDFVANAAQDWLNGIYAMFTKFVITPVELRSACEIPKFPLSTDLPKLCNKLDLVKIEEISDPDSVDVHFGLIDDPIITEESNKHLFSGSNVFSFLISFSPELDTQLFMSETMLLSPNEKHRRLRICFIKLQFSDPVSPELLEIPDLKTDFSNRFNAFVRIHSSRKVQPLSLERFRLKSLLRDPYFNDLSAKTINEVIHTWKSTCRKMAAPRYKRRENVCCDNILEDPLLEPMMKIPTKASPEKSHSPSFADSELLSFSSVSEFEKTFNEPKRPCQDSINSKRNLQSSQRRIARPREYTLDDFIALTTKQPQKKPKFADNQRHRIKEISVAPDDAIMDVVDLIFYAAESCTKTLQIHIYLKAADSLATLSIESARQLFKRIVSRLRQCDRAQQNYLLLCELTQNALMFATLRCLLNVVIHAGITAACTQLRCKMQGADLANILKFRSGSVCYEELHDLIIRLELLTGEVVHERVADHPKIAILLDNIESATIIVVHNRVLMPIIMIAISSSSHSALKIAQYEKGMDFVNVDVLIAHHEPLFQDGGFPWARFRKLILYERRCELKQLGEYVCELIDEGRLSCIVLQTEETKSVAKHVKQRPVTDGNHNYDLQRRCIISNSNMLQNVDICQALSECHEGLVIVSRDEFVTETTLVVSPCSMVMIRAIPSTDEAQTFIESVTQLYVQYTRISLIIVHELEAIITDGFIQVQLWLMAGLASSRIGMVCNLDFVTSLEQITSVINREISSESVLVSETPSSQESFLASLPSINPMAASVMANAGKSLADLFSMALTDLKSLFPNLPQISLELFYNASNEKIGEGIRDDFEEETVSCDVPSSTPAQSGGRRQRPEEDSRKLHRKGTPGRKNHTLDEYWGPITKRSCVSRSSASS